MKGRDSVAWRNVTYRAVVALPWLHCRAYRRKEKKKHEGRRGYSLTDSSDLAISLKYVRRFVYKVCILDWIRSTAKLQTRDFVQQ